MHNSSFKESQNDLLYQHNSSDASLTRKHGLDIPSENLTHITAYLDPHSLLSLSRVNTQLYAHVKEEHTWRTAFALNFLGIGPEGDLSDFKGRLLRRSEPSWRREYIVRYNLRRYLFRHTSLYFLAHNSRQTMGTFPNSDNHPYSCPFTDNEDTSSVFQYAPVVLFKVRHCRSFGAFDGENFTRIPLPPLLLGQG